MELFSLQLIKLLPNDAFFKYTTGSHYGGQIRRLQNVLVLVYKCVNGLMPTYLSSNFVERNSGYDLRCKRITRSSEIEDVYACSNLLYLFRDESLEFTNNARTASNICSFIPFLDDTISYCNAICCLFLMVYIVVNSHVVKIIFNIVIDRTRLFY